MANYAERFLLMQALIVRRVPQNSKIAPALLLEAVAADMEKVRLRRPELYFGGGTENIGREINICIEEGLIQDALGRLIGDHTQATGLRRTAMGAMLISSLEPRLEDDLDSMPMSDVGVLDFLSLL